MNSTQRDARTLHPVSQSMSTLIQLPAKNSLHEEMLFSFGSGVAKLLLLLSLANLLWDVPTLVSGPWPLSVQNQ